MITYINDEIIKIVEGLFKDRTIMFIYYCGSISYGINGLIYLILRKIMRVLKDLSIRR